MGHPDADAARRHREDLVTAEAEASAAAWRLGAYATGFALGGAVALAEVPGLAPAVALLALGFLGHLARKLVARRQALGAARAA